MQRPDQRPFRKLPTLEPRRGALETCVFCPKLCRSACPVSNAEPRETVTPWGKMSSVYFVANESVPDSLSHAAPAWACTGCFACRESCDHQNDVTGSLLAARGALASLGHLPDGAARAIAGFEEHERKNREGLRAIAKRPGSPGRRGHPPTVTSAAVLVGCAYVKRAPDVAADAIRAASALAESEAPAVEACCGLPLLMAGDAAGFERKARAFAEETAGAEEILVADAGCALALRVRYAEAKVALAPKVTLLVERAARELARLRPERERRTVRYHDPCQLGRGLGVYEAPRAVLTRVLGRAPEEFVHERERAQCSGAGGLLPSTMPATSRAIAQARVAEHLGLGGGTIVTACGSSLVGMRRAGAKVEDIVSVIARAL
jgi:Fe-S oxidoreductase